MKKILLIEDNDIIRNNTAELLELSNYKVEVAENGKTGVEKAILSNPDLIICDIMMPVMDGYGVLHAVHKNEVLKHTPFIFLTAKTERVDFRKAMDMGADDYISKPFTATELLTAVDSRIKKATELKQDLTAGTDGYNSLLQIATGKKAIEELTQYRSINTYKRKQVIYSEGNHPSRIYYVLKGKIKAYKRNEAGKELITDLYNTGDFLGHIALLGGGTYKDTAVALEETDLAIIPGEDFNELLHKNPEAAGKFIQMLAKNIAEKETQLLKLAYSSLRKKVADALLMLQKKYQDQTDGPFTIDITRENLAAVAGTATESLIRTLGDFKDEKIIDFQKQKGKIVILNTQKLEQMHE
ncbi:MAG: response regulator [Chitinophagaceae bacterium]|nr:response regulator [Chitinophagaceae bacterium]